LDEQIRKPEPAEPVPGDLNHIEVRILGSLIEKESTTPEYYPLTLNALTNACCQKNNRDPVVSYDDTTVVRALESLREKKLVSTVTGAGMRVPKYRHKIIEAYGLNPAETAVMGLLMLRGPQTVGELRTRAGPMHPFAGLPEVQATLEGLMKNETRPALARMLPRQPGQKEVRYIHLLGGDVPAEVPKDSTHPAPHPALHPERAVIQVQAENARIAAIEEELKTVHRLLDDLQRQFQEFRKQFE
jgi:uncharacterized protein YceH (UPF0502 family)